MVDLGVACHRDHAGVELKVKLLEGGVDLVEAGVRLQGRDCQRLPSRVRRVVHAADRECQLPRVCREIGSGRGETAVQL